MKSPLEPKPPIELRIALATEPCPDEATLAQGLDPEGEPPTGLVGHLAGCARCQAVLGLLDAEPLAPPAVALGAVRRATEPAPAHASLLVRVVDGLMEWIAPDAVVREPALARSPEASGGVLVEHRLGDVILATHLSYSEGSGFVILLDVQGRAEDLRLTLRRASRELRSDRMSRGHVLFGSVPPGQYRLDVDRGGERLGVLELDLET